MIYLRVLGPGKLAEWHAFHAAHKSQFVKERDPVQLEKAARDSKLFVLQTENGDIRGSCGCFEYGEEGDFREIGAVRVLDEGCGLQVLLMSVAVASEWMFDIPPEPILAVTAQDNIASRTNILRTGFEPVTSLSNARLTAMSLVSLNPDKVYFQFPLDKAEPGCVSFVRQIKYQGFIEKHGRIIPVQLDIPLAQLL